MATKKALIGAVLSVLFSAGMSGPALAGTPFYTVTQLGFGATGNYFSSAYDVNNNGQVVGNSSFYSGNTRYDHAFEYSNGTTTDIGKLVANGSTALSINNNGEVLGRVAGSYFTYSGGTVTNLGDLTGGKPYELSGINDSGQLTGTVTITPQDCNIDYCTPAVTHAFTYANGVMTDLGTLYGGQGSSSGFGINNLGQVIGVSASHAFLYRGGVMSDLGTLGGAYSAAYSVNDNGQAVGVSDGPTGNGVTQAFLYSDGKMTGLGTLGGSYSTATDINNAGQVVGFSVLGAGGEHAFLFGGGSMVDLNSVISPSSGWTLLRAYAINDSGQIVGYGWINGQTQPFLLTPVATVPEPSAVWLFGFGLAVVMGVARKRKAA